MEYQLQCGADELAFYNITFLDMQSEEDCQTEDGDNRWAIIMVMVVCNYDYVKVNLFRSHFPNLLLDEVNLFPWIISQQGIPLISALTYTFLHPIGAKTTCR